MRRIASRLMTLSSLRTAATIPRASGLLRHRPGQKDLFATDEIISKLTPPIVDDDVVTFRGWLGPLEGGFFRLFTSRSLDRWLEIPEHALLYQLPGKSAHEHDAFSIVWVRHEARLIESRRAKARQLVDASSQTDTDPGAHYPMYGHGH
jgi:hypothetical protein